MPIMPEDCGKYDLLIKDIVDAAWVPDDAMNTAEHVGYFIYSFVREYAVYARAGGEMDDSFMEHSPKRLNMRSESRITFAYKNLDLIKILDQKPGFENQCEDIHYIISSVLWSILAGAKDRKALGVFLQGVVGWVKVDYLRYIQDIRCYIMLYGILSDVMDELYDRKSIMYEQCIENKNIQPVS